MGNRSMHRKILLFGWLSLLVMEAYFLIHIVRELHWPGPVQDFWGSILFIEKSLSSGNWFDADLWGSQNNHRLVLPRLAFLVDYRFFHGTNHFLTGLSIYLLIIEGLIFYLLIEKKESAEENWIIYFSVLSVLLLPSISYNFLNTFNIQWIQCAFLALSACVAYSYGLASGRNIWLCTGIFLAMLCCFTTFSLTAIWPALFFLLWISAANKNQWVVLGLVSAIFSIIFIFILPINEDFGTGSQYKIPPLIDIVEGKEKIWKTIFFLPIGLLSYLVGYLSFPLPERWQLMSYLVTTISLIWFFVSLFFYRSNKINWKNSSLLAVIFFVVCLGITTGIGRGFMGELSYGIRFYPIVLLYWAAFFSCFFIKILSMGSKKTFFVTNLIGLVILLVVGILDAIKINKRLAEEHNRYGRMQMAYITDNLHPNALYENLVPEWRATSYPGILAAIPHLKNNQWGIFHDNIGRFLLSNASLSKDGMEGCVNIGLQEKPRNNDEDIRNITFRHDNVDMSITYPYLLIYSDEKIIGAAFRQRHALFEKINKSIWIGMSSMPKSASENYVVVALDQQNKPCLAKIRLD